VPWRRTVNSSESNPSPAITGSWNPIIRSCGPLTSVKSAVIAIDAAYLRVVVSALVEEAATVPSAMTCPDPIRAVRCGLFARAAFASDAVGDAVA
jgi:hypothetical protein